jgi:hypothetical protein
MFRSLKDLCRDIREKLLPILPRDIGTVYGIPRSGMIPASIIATAIGARLGVLGGPSFIGARQKNFAFQEGDKTLVVDDSVHHGRAIAGARATIESLTAGYYTCAVYAHPRSLHLVDFYADVLEDQRIFEWNFAGIKAAGKFCWSLDGVICAGISEPPDRSAVSPVDFLSAKPLHLPQVRVRAIVAERDERWRAETETWLARYGVVYDELIMIPDTPAIRRSSLSLAKHKAACLVETECELLVEGRDSVAKTIARVARRQVLSVESMELYSPAPEGTLV